ncbi:hypothetical protein THRCLA_09103 [Thraustotheca clavata]|uniref:FAD-binding FR-type domain-containing protein n=1 Tax=Thraustotheca clavata TaxID=74557 RepID=A0A1V9YZD7_9STRA|nr:hypothetical protein THRCLA_09103 [Thraustotheca clavata]
MATNLPSATVDNTSFEQVSTPTFNDNVKVVQTSPKNTPLTLAVHCLVGLLMLFSVFSVTIYYTPLRDPTTNNILNKWYNINPKIKGSGHSEMTMYTYFFFGMILPLLVAFLLVRLVTKGVPAPLPYLSHWLHRKPRFLLSLVSYGELCFLVVVFLGNFILFYYFYTARLKPKMNSTQKIDLIGKTLGFSCLYNMTFLALPATRHCFWMEWLSIPYAHGIKYHRWLGVVTIVALFLHMAFYIKFYDDENELDVLLPCFNCNIASEGRENWVNTFGWLSGISMFIMAGTSLPFIRRRFYNTFYLTHFLFIPAAIFAVLHWGPIIIWLFVTIVLYIVNRMMSSATIQAPVSIAHAVATPHHVTELVVECATSYQAGDVVYLKVPAVSKTQWHPFSVASTPLHTPGLMTIYIKTLGPWTQKVHEYVRQCTEAKVNPVVYMDGGYPSPALIPASYEKVVFIGGGIGVTPLMAQIMHVLHTNSTQQVHLIWHVRDARMMVHFQDWFHQATMLADTSRLRFHLYVTQKTSSMDIADEKVHLTQFKLEEPSVQPRPYSNLSTLRQVLMMVLAFGCAGGLLTIVHYGYKFQAIDPKYWPLQRFMEFVAVVVGAYWAYVVVLIKPYKSMSNVPMKSPDEMTKEKSLSIEAFVDRFKVQYCRADWMTIFEQLRANCSNVHPAIGVYVSGPKSLSRAIDAVANTSIFAVHHEEFEM